MSVFIFRRVTPALLQTYHNLGRLVFTYTVNEPAGDSASCATWESTELSRTFRIASNRTRFLRWNTPQLGIGSLPRCPELQFNRTAVYSHGSKHSASPGVRRVIPRCEAKIASASQPLDVSCTMRHDPASKRQWSSHGHTDWKATIRDRPTVEEEGAQNATGDPTLRWEVARGWRLGRQKNELCWLKSDPVEKNGYQDFRRGMS